MGLFVLLLFCMDFAELVHVWVLSGYSSFLPHYNAMILWRKAIDGIFLKYIFQWLLFLFKVFVNHQ